MRTVNIAVCNLAATPLGVDFRQMVRAAQTQINRDFLPLWKEHVRRCWKIDSSDFEFNLIIVDGYTDDYPIQLVLDNADQANALGYHTVTAKGWPIGKTFVRTVIGARERPSVTFTHEVLEMIGNPLVREEVRDPKTGWVYPSEASDACQGDDYEIDGVPVTDFITPHWWNRNPPAAAKFDFLGVLPGPFTLAKGGYTPVNKGRGWEQIFGSLEAQQRYEAHEHSRVPLILGQLAPLRSFAVDTALMQQHPAFAKLGFSWEALKGAVAKFGPVVLDCAVALVNNGFSVQWVTETIQKIADAWDDEQKMAALLPGIKAGLGGIVGDWIKNMLVNWLKTVDWQALIKQFIEQIIANVGKPAAGALPVAAN